MPAPLAPRALERRLAFMARAIAHGWDRYECPTWCVVLAIYGGWFVLMRYHAELPWWVILPLGTWLVAWHGSLQHETIHAFASVPRPLRIAIASLPLGVFFPYGSYVREHRQHHRASRLTNPRLDPESFYHDPQQWRRYAPILRAIFRCNQTLLGRLVFGAVIQAVRSVRADARHIIGGDRRVRRDWTIHWTLVAVLFTCIVNVFGMPWWQYVVLIAYPGVSLAMLRSFYEHSWNPNVGQRTAVVENRFPFGLLFLNNNYHVVHHAAPSLPWYRIPAVWNEHRGAFLAENAGRYFAGYGVLVQRWFLRPVFDPISPGD